MCNSLVWGLVALEGGTADEKGECTWLARALSEAAVEMGMGEQCLMLASLRSFFLRFSTAAMRKKLTVILLVVNSSFSLLSLGCIWGIPLADAVASLSSYPCLPWLVTGNQLLCLLLTWC